MSKSADAFRTISEVADWLGVQTHVLRFWESKFPQIKPVKRAGGRRYYRPGDMLLLGGIRKLLHEDGMTIKGVQKILREDGIARVSDMSAPLDAETDLELDSDLINRALSPVELEPIPTSEEPLQDLSLTSSADVLSLTPSTASDVIEDDENQPEGIDHAPIPPMQAVPDPEEKDDGENVAWADRTAPTQDDAPAPVPLAQDPDPATAPLDDAHAPSLTTDFVPDADAPSLAEASEDSAEQSGELAEQASFDLMGTPGPFDAPKEEDATVADVTPEPAMDPPVAQSDPPQLMFRRFNAEAAPESAPDVQTEPVAEPAPETTTLSSANAPPLRPRIVDVPDDIPIDVADIAPTLLTKSAQLTQLTHTQRAAISPLVTQLAALRDTMAGALHDQR